MFTARIFLLVAAVALGSANAHASVREFDKGVPIAWTPNRTVVMHLSLPNDRTNFTDGSTSYDAVATDALNIWNQYLVHMHFAIDHKSILPPSGTDGNTSVIMSNTIYGDAFGKNVLAVTLVTPRNSTLLEADV